MHVCIFSLSVGRKTFKANRTKNALETFDCLSELGKFTQLSKNCDATLTLILVLKWHHYIRFRISPQIVYQFSTKVSWNFFYAFF